MMETEISLEKLAGLDFNSWVCEIPEDDERWFRMVELKKDMCPDLDGWLLQKGLERTPANAFRYISERYDAVYGERDRLEYEKSNRQLHEADHKLSWDLGLGRFFRIYKDNPYTGPMGIGHYVGVKVHPKDNPLDYEGHDIGIIRDYETDAKGEIIRMTLEKEDMTTLVVPADYTYRIY